ncbi:acyl-CoA dehydrogenase family protein [Rothia uropygialis]|uniref:acyl-CoA dehydrogenase n=1 Tax=Kocuria sp. 36 TaxID=1415402 RepID=UPI00101B7947|nr:acyl-CoA dehydrogenase [Kocuria sp. 36]
MTLQTVTYRARLPHELEEKAREAAGDPELALRIAPDIARELGSPGNGNTLSHWQGLAALGAIDLTVARTVEPHLDALAILDQATEPRIEIPEGSTWGVYAAESANDRLEATQMGHGQWRITGSKPWCSLARYVSHALVTAWTSKTERRLFAVSLAGDGVVVTDGHWVARGLRAIQTSSIEFDNVPAEPVGADQWYFSRPGFALGGIGVAAVWWGAACALAHQLETSCRSRTPDQIALYHLGQCSTELEAAGNVLASAAIHGDDALGAEAKDLWPLALRVRGTVHKACETVLSAVGHTLGPGPLTQDEEYARRVTDLQVYVQQYKPERDVAGVGQAILDGATAIWARA